MAGKLLSSQVLAWWLYTRKTYLCRLFSNLSNCFNIPISPFQPRYMKMLWKVHEWTYRKRHQQQILQIRHFFLVKESNLKNCLHISRPIIIVPKGFWFCINDGFYFSLEINELKLESMRGSQQFPQFFFKNVKSIPLYYYFNPGISSSKISAHRYFSISRFLDLELQ